jgi:hypothetical protein
MRGEAGRLEMQDGKCSSGDDGGGSGLVVVEADVLESRGDAEDYARHSGVEHCLDIPSLVEDLELHGTLPGVLDPPH